MIVYVEAVIFDNFCLDSLLGYLTLTLSGGKIRASSLALSASVGSAIALTIPVVPDAFLLLLKVATLFLCSAIFSIRSSLRRYLVNTFLYAILSFLLCGILSFLLGTTANGLIGISFGGAVGALSLAVLLLLYSARQIRGLIREKRRKDHCVVAEVVNNDKIVRLKALYDSGNLLTDQSGAGVVVSDRKRLAEIGEFASIGEMRVKTATGSRVLPLVKIPEIKIYSHEGENILTNVTAALSDLPDEYALILPCE